MLIKLKTIKVSRVSLIIGLTGVLIVAAVGLLVHDYIHAKAEVKRIESAQTGDGEVGVLVRELKSYLELPTAEVPTVATVNDLTSLKDQKFFDSAKKGDKVIVYPNYGKAILYRPSEKKIIEYAPVNYN